MSDKETLESRSQPIIPLLSSYCYNVYDLLQHEFDRLNAIDPKDLEADEVIRRNVFNRFGIDNAHKYVDIAFGVLENGYFLHGLSSAAYIANYSRQSGEFHARKHLDAAVWETNAFIVKDSVAEEMEADLGDESNVYKMTDTYRATNPRVVVTQGLGDERNTARTTHLNIGHLLGWIHGVDNVNENYRDVTLAFGVLPNGFVVVGQHQSYDHDTYSSSNGRNGAIADLEQKVLPYRLLVGKTDQHNVNKLRDLDKALDTFEPVPNTFTDIATVPETFTSAPTSHDPLETDPRNP